MKAFKDRDFTLWKYQKLCAAIHEAGYVGLGMGDYLGRRSGELPPRIVLLRHDVESAPGHSLDMAAVEAGLGLVATYFYRTKRGAFDPAVIRRAAAMGHEVGYHYETLSQAWGNVERALVLFARGLEKLRAEAPVRVASMHGSPLLPWDNREIWRKASPADFGLAGEVYLDIDYGEVAYFSDTGRTWHPTRYNVRDRAAVLPRWVVETTDEMIDLVRSGRIERLCLVTHPERWPSTVLSWCARAIRDQAENRVKVGLGRLYAGAARSGGPR